LIVLDASAVVEILNRGALVEGLMAKTTGSGEALITPHLLDLEVANAIRGLTAARHLDSARAEVLLSELAAFPAERRAHTPLLERIWELRHNFTAYDAAYIALAEAEGAVLYTCDSKLCKGHRAKVVLFAAN